MGSELAEVTAALRDLQDQVQHLTRAVEHLSLVVRDRHHSPPRASTAASAVGSPYRAPSATSTSSEYNALAREIPPIPDGIRALASALRSEAGARAERAWTIGYWARFCLAGRIRSPRPSPPCKHSNCIYVVLKAPGFACPLVCTRGSDYRHVVGSFEGDTLSHGFASISEAKIYCFGAGVEYPDSIYEWQRLR